MGIFPPIKKNICKGVLYTGRDLEVGKNKLINMGGTKQEANCCFIEFFLLGFPF